MTPRSEGVQIEEEMLGHVADQIGYEVSGREAPFAVDSRELIVVPTSPDGLQRQLRRRGLKDSAVGAAGGCITEVGNCNNRVRGDVLGPRRACIRVPAGAIDVMIEYVLIPLEPQRRRLGGENSVS